MELKRLGPNAQVLIALVSGVLIGLVLSMSHNSTWISIGVSLETIGKLWINAIRMTVIPLVISLLFVSMTGFPDVRSAGRSGIQALMIFMGLLCVSTVT
jgi:Na+/H+-dicarboxylate symporter